MSEKVIRIWDGCKVVQVVAVDQNGGSSTLGPAGGAGNSTRIDIEIDPWAGLLVDHPSGPVAWRDYDKDIAEAYAAGEHA
jgi:hypothetical protein